MKASVTFSVTKTVIVEKGGFNGLDEARAAVRKELRERLKGYRIEFGVADEEG